jgi:hypothetical protein
LAAGLVLLTNWRPAKSFSISEEESLSLIFKSHLFTVNPLEQLNQAGILAKLKAQGQGSPKTSSGDDWLFYLTVMNHPQTPDRIKTLWKMSEDLKAKKIPPAPIAAR